MCSGTSGFLTVVVSQQPGGAYTPTTNSTDHLVKDGWMRGRHGPMAPHHDFSDDIGRLGTRSACSQWDHEHPLAAAGHLFNFPKGAVFLASNSLGPTPRSTASTVHEVITSQWQQQSSAGWVSSNWAHAPQRIGAQIAPLIGAHPADVVVADSTSMNLYKTLVAALQAATPGRNTIIVDATNFPSDLYIAQGVAAHHGATVRTVAAEESLSEVIAAEAERVAVVSLTDVNYRTGARLPMAEVTAIAHAAGAQMVWDLAHCAGSCDIDLTHVGADYAVGSGSKYLNGGPGAPGFVWVHPQHQTAAAKTPTRTQPAWGWWGSAAPFDYEPTYQPGPGVTQFLCSSPNVLGLAALACGVSTFDVATATGGITAIRHKSVALTQLLMTLVAQQLNGLLECLTPADPADRGSHVSFCGIGAALGAEQAIMTELANRGIIGTVKTGAAGTNEPDIMRFAVAGQYCTATDIWDTAATLTEVTRAYTKTT